MTAIRAATHADASAVSALEVQVFADDAWSERSLDEEFAAMGASRRILIAADGDSVVGYAVLLTTAEAADLTRVAVDAARRRNGIGSMLVDAALREARASGLRRVLLEVADANAAAVALYAKHGFDPIDRRAAYYADGSDAVVMCRPLDDEVEGLTR